MRFRGRLGWCGLAIGVVGGVLDTALFLSLGVDFAVAGRDMTAFVAIYLAAGFAALGYAVGYFIDARARARRDAHIIQEQLEALESSQRLAAQNEKLAAIGRLAAGVAHEVRNPLGVIRASASMVQESFGPEDEAHRACGFICEEIDRLNGLIASLLSFARPAEPRFQTVSLQTVLDRAIRLEAQQLEQRRIGVERIAHGSLPEIVADPDMLSQMLLGLMTNAAEAVGEGGRIAVRVADDADGVDVEVADSGPGISHDDSKRIFEPFFTTKTTGTGLGLAMTARIVQAHGGRIEVRQGAGAGPNGSGACFHVRLPLDPGPRGALATAEAPA
jgi:signal transduction histidine kinase